MINKKFETIDKYIESFPSDVQSILKRIRQTIKKSAPKATEGISYGMPVFKLNGNLVYFGGFKDHISLFPGSSVIVMSEFKKELEGLKTSKGTIQFRLDKPVPYNLIKRITEFRVKENLQKNKNKNKY